MEPIKWKYVKSEVSQETIREVEREMGIMFPEDYIQCVKKNNGGRPTHDTYDLEEREGLVFNYLLSLNEQKYGYIVRTYENVRDRLVDGIYPFANDPFGNLICFDYRANPNDPTIVFWDHEEASEDPERALHPICSTFTELMDKLYEND